MESFRHKVTLPAGEVQVFASTELFAGLDYKVFEMANNNLLIPDIQFMSYTPDVHVGVGTCIGTTAVWDEESGYVSPSIVGSDIGCGMRVHLTNLHKRDLADIGVRRKLVKAIEKYLPMENHSRGYYSDIRLEHVLKKGLHGLPKKYLPDSYTPKQATSLTHVESSRFGFDESVLDIMPEQAFHRAHRQLGTLGGGNHFVELQAVEIAEDQQETAKAWGLSNDQIVVMIHSGSRAWGGAVNQLCTVAFKRAMAQLQLGSADSKLLFAPLQHPAGQQYVNLMYSALNYAVANRHMIGYAVRQGLQDVFGHKCETSTLYDLMHNYAWQEELHPGKSLFVHRKGATRALPPNHSDNPAPYKQTGHPALIPGSMGSASYIMVGKEEGAANYYSICHGAGRVRSRSATKQLVSVEEFAQAIGVGTEDEVVVNHLSLDSIIDESPQAYKNVDEIIASVKGAGLADVVVKCKPIATIKGTK